jgi:two-component system phosphate regulon sensor histidine kinase PhoR
MNRQGTASSLTGRVLAVAVGLIGAGLVVALTGNLTAAAFTLAAGIVAGVISGRTAIAPAIAADPAGQDGSDIQPILDAVEIPLLLSADGRVVRANRAAARLLGGHIVNADIRLAIRHPEAAETLTGPAPESRAPVTLAGLGGRGEHWSVSAAMLPPQGDAGDRRLIALVDRSGSHAAERMRVDFVANASHELRTPLAAILGFVETLSEPQAGGDVATRRRFLEIIGAEARRMQRLVDDLMSLSRIEAEKYRAPDSALDLAPLVREVVGIFHASHGARGREVVADIMDAPAVLGERAQLSQLLHNLIGNAVKYGRPGTPVTVGLSPADGRTVRLTIRDEGDGIAPDHLPRLTERFYRIDPSRSKAAGGTGLGLAIVKHIVERHRGRLDISSEVGVGTTISVALPIATQEAA